jgi:hypothetical protein
VTQDKNIRKTKYLYIKKQALPPGTGYVILKAVTRFFEQDILNPGHVPARLFNL